jgi:hypothetical protein
MSEEYAVEKMGSERVSGPEGAGGSAGPMSQATARGKAARWSKARVNRGEKKLGDNQLGTCGK